MDNIRLVNMYIIIEDMIRFFHLHIGATIVFGTFEI